MKTRAAVIVLLVLGAGFLVLALAWGRLTASPQAASGPTSSASVTSAPAPMRTPEPPPVPISSGDRDMIWPTATGRPTPPAQAGPAVRALTAFLRPSTPSAAKTWWSSLRPLLTAGAQQDYAPTDPTQVPPTRITGAPAELVVDEGGDELAGNGGDDGHDAEVAVVAIPTDAGIYAVWVITDGPETGKVSRIRPAQS